MEIQPPAPLEPSGPAKAELSSAKAELSSAKKRGLKFGLSIAVVIICLVAAGVAVYWIKTEPIEQNPININITKPTNETANWQTYRNTRYSYEFKYPQNIDIVEMGIGYALANEESYDIVLTGKSNDKEISAVWIPNLTKEEANLSLNDFVNKTAEGFDKKEDFILDGKKAVKLTFGDEKEEKNQGIDISSVSFVANNTIIAIVKYNQIFILFQLLDTSDEVLFDQILSTFKFIEPIDTSGWQTYRNEEYGFEVKYPTGWFIYKDNTADVFIQKEQEISGGIPGPHADAFEIKVTPIPSNESLAQAVEKSEKEINSAGISFNQENILIGGIQSTRIESVCEGLGCGAPEWFVIKNNYLYHFNSNLGYTDVFDQILSTFKFIK